MVSIITPTHKRMPLVELVIESVLSQTSPDWEWVVLDISETPYFRDVFESFKNSHSKYYNVFGNVKIFEKNMVGRPIGEVKRECITHLSCGPNEWTLQLDHDDILYKTAVQDILGCDAVYGEQVDYMAGDRYSIVYEIKTNSFSPAWFSNSRNFEFVKAPALEVGYFGLELGGKNAVRYTHMASGDIAPIHPRVLRKRFVDNPAFAPGVVDLSHEDLIQQTMVGWLLKGAWIERPLLADVTYIEDRSVKNNPVFLNTSRNIENDPRNTGDAYGVASGLIELFGKLVGQDYKREFLRYRPNQENN